MKVVVTTVYDFLTDEDVARLIKELAEAPGFPLCNESANELMKNREVTTQTIHPDGKRKATTTIEILSDQEVN